MRGRFIVFEGIDGSGKSTAIRAAEEALSAQGIEVWRTREETDTWRGEAVRRSIAESSAPLATAFAFMADRAAHVPQIEAALASGRHVLCDRYVHSTLAYQGVTLAGHVEGVDAWLRSLHEPLGLWPDHVLLFDLEPAVSLQRAQARGATSVYEKEAFLGDVRKAYLDMVGDDWTVIDASKGQQQVAEDVIRRILALLA